MAIPPDLMSVRLTASLGGDENELAVFGFHLQRIHIAGNPTNWASDVNDAAEKIRDKWNTNVIGKAQWSQAVRMEKVDVYHLDTSNHALDKGTALFEGDDAWEGVGQVSLPYSSSCVVSLFGYQPGTLAPQRGRKRGRFYLPPLATTVMDGFTGLYNVETGAAVANVMVYMKNWLNDIEGMSIGGPYPDVDDFVHLGILSIASQAFVQCRYVAIDSIPDVMRSRVNKLPGERLVETITVEE